MQNYSNLKSVEVQPWTSLELLMSNGFCLITNPRNTGKKQQQQTNKQTRPVVRGGAGGATHHPKSPKRSTFSHKMGQKWVFCRRVKGDEVQKVHFLGPKGPLFGGTAPPLNRSWLRAWNKQTNKTALNHMCKIILTENPLRFNFELLLNY